MSDRAVPHPNAIRTILIAVGAVQTLNGLYALLDPSGFYDDFPLGRGWVAAYPDYSEHLVADVGGLFIATGVMMILAGLILSRQVILVATVSWLLAEVPHTILHLTDQGLLEDGDFWVSGLSLISFVVLPGWVLLTVLRDTAAQPSTTGVAPPATARVVLLDRPKGLVARLTYRESRRRFTVVTDPVKALAHTPALLAGYGALETVAERSHHADERLKDLAVIRAGMLVGCEWCLDFGSAKMLAAGIPEEDLKALPNYAASERFSALERLVLDYATAMSRTPVEVSDELLGQLREDLSDAAIVEITLMISLEHLRARFNWALGIGSQGFSEGSFCVAPEASRPRAETADQSRASA